MITQSTFLAAAAVLAASSLTSAFATSLPPASCGESSAAARGFRLDVDWGRAVKSDFGAHPDLLQTGPWVKSVCSIAAAVLPASALVRPARPIAYQSRVPETRQADDTPSWLVPFSFFVSVAGVYDTNINHSEEPLEASGLVAGVGARFETDNFEAEYEVANHSYSNTDRWDRVSQSLTTSYEQRLARKLTMEAVGELTLKGSSEDRELNDQYVLEPRVNYRISPSSRLRLYGAHRLKRYDDNAERDATNQYLGLELRQRVGSGNVDLGYRWETNRAEGARYRYERETFTAQYATPFAGGLHRLALEVRYRPQRYSNRFVDDEDDEPLRRDRRWIASAGASISLSEHLELLPGYRYETRFSNDEEEEFDAHVGFVGLRYWFGKGNNPHAARRRSADRPESVAKKEERTDDDELESLERAPRTGAANAPPPAPAVADVWSRRAEADRADVLRGRAGRYAIDLGVSCGARSLEDAWRHDAGSALWLLPDRGHCFRLLWGHFASRRDAERALSGLPGYFRDNGRSAAIVPIASALSELGVRP